MSKSNNIKKLKVLGDYLIVKEIIEEQEVNGLVKPVQYEDKAFTGEVVAIGKKVEDVSVGDIVYFNKYSSVKFDYDGADYLTLREEDIVCYTS